MELQGRTAYGGGERLPRVVIWEAQRGHCEAWESNISQGFECTGLATSTIQAATLNTGLQAVMLPPRLEFRVTELP